MNGNKISSILSICAPAMVYLILSVIGLIIASAIQFSVISILLKVIFIALWTFLLNFLCANGLTIVSWILVLLPIIFMVASIFMVINFMSNASKNRQGHNKNDMV